MIGAQRLRKCWKQSNPAARPTQEDFGELVHWPKLAASKIALIVPSGDKLERAAKDIIRVLFLNPALREHIAIYRAEFGIEMLACDVREVHDFFDSFMTLLIASPQSLLYAEIQQNRNFAQHGYAYPEHNRLLHFLLSPCTNAQRLSAYKPLGEHFLAKVRAENVDYVRYLNGAADMYENEECWRNSSFVTVQFFELMVTAAIWEGIRCHMWLFYYPHFMESLVSIYDGSDSISMSSLNFQPEPRIS